MPAWCDCCLLRLLLNHLGDLHLSNILQGAVDQLVKVFRLFAGSQYLMYISQLLPKAGISCREEESLFLIPEETSNT